MDGELWKGLYRAVFEVGKQAHNYRVQYGHVWIVLVYLWAVLHDRPVSWACSDRNWPASQRHWPKPSPSTMSRRLRRPEVRAMLDDLLQRLNAQLGRSGLCWMDGKPLVIGGHSKDPDAGYGRAAGCKSKGYKLHAIWDASGALVTHQVHPINVSEQKVARSMIDQLEGGGYLVADAGYDSNPLYEHAGQRGYQMLAPRRYRKAKGLGHHRHSIYRLRAIQMLQQEHGRALLRRRTAIERQFGCLGNFPGGLGPLPNWVRRLRRVELWVTAKLTINSLRILTRKQRLAA